MPAYGQSFTEKQTAQLAYLRALRRVDPCGLLLMLKDIGAPTYISGDVGGCFRVHQGRGFGEPVECGAVTDVGRLFARETRIQGR